MTICSFVQQNARVRVFILLCILSGVISTCCVRQEAVAPNADHAPASQIANPGQTANRRAARADAPLSGIVKAVFGSNGSAWVLDHKGQLLLTRDAGKSWIILGGAFVRNFDMFTIAQGRIGLAADSDGRVWRSDDGGQSWNSISTLTRADPAEHYMMASQIQLLNDGLKAWIVDTFAVWSTTDGGRSWQEVNDLSFRVQKKQVRQISFLSSGSPAYSVPDSSLGWAVGDAGLILHTKDGGVSWQAIGKDLPVNVGTSINALKFVSPARGWLAVTDPSEPLPERAVLFTNDGGNSWERQKEIKDNVSITSIFFLDNDTGWMVGGDEVSGAEAQRGLLLKTSNAGRTWERARSLPTTDAIKDVYFSSLNEGWFFTDFDLFRTNDGGKSWVSVLSYPEVRQKNVEKLGPTAVGH